MSRLAERRRFVALRACWTILRGGSVAWDINVTGGGFDALSAPTFISGCQVEGVPVTAEHIWHGSPREQPD